MNIFLNILLIFVSSFLALVPIQMAWDSIKRKAKEYE